MGQGATPVGQVHPSGFPSAVVAGACLAFQVFIPGDPIQKDRPRGRVVQPKGGKAWIQWYSTKKTEDYERLVTQESLRQLRSVEVDGDQDFTLPIRDCRYLINLRFNFEKPKSYPKTVVHMTKMPDIDNLAKSVLDGLVGKDGSQVLDKDGPITDLTLQKRYADDAHPPGVEISVTCVPL